MSLRCLWSCHGNIIVHQLFVILWYWYAILIDTSQIWSRKASNKMVYSLTPREVVYRYLPHILVVCCSSRL